MASTDDHRAIERLVFTYAERVDAGDFDGVGELFRHGRILAAPGVSIEGEEAVRKLYERTTRRYEDGTPRTKHLTTNVMVDLADDEQAATAHSYFTVFQQTEVLPLQAIIAGRYRDTFHRVAGNWCFDTREMFVDLAGDLSQHLLIEL